MIEKDIRICFVGESLVNGTSDRTDLGWTALTDSFPPGLSCYLSQSDIWIQEVEAGDGAHLDAAGSTERARIVQAWFAWNTFIAF